MTKRNSGTRYPGVGEPVDDEMTEADVEDFELEEEEDDGSYNPDKDYSKKELEELADTILRDDSNRELCRQCKGEEPDTLPYGHETGEIAWQIQYAKDGVTPLLDDEENTLYVGFPELECHKGHRWYKGEGPRRDIRGPNPILFETHLYNRKRREIQVKDGVPDPAFTMDRWGKRPVQGMYYRCVDEATQALTPAGWRSCNQIVPGESIWAYDIESDSCHWGTVTDMYIDDHCGWMQTLESQNISARTTQGHSWAVAHERDKSARFVTRQLLERHYIPMPRPPQTNEVTGREDLFELLGWVITDGTFRSDKNDALVYQALHNPKVKSLRQCLSSNGVNPQPQHVDGNNVGRWAIPVKVGRPMRSLVANVKSFAALDLDVHAPTEYQSLLRGAMYGDGYRRAPNQAEMITTKSAEADGIQGLQTVVGHGSRLKYYHRPQAIMPDMYVVTQKHTDWAYVRPALQEPEWYEGTIWCPSTDTGFWVARRAGKTYVTGNTHPSGRKVNTDQQRKTNGASYYR